MMRFLILCLVVIGLSTPVFAKDLLIETDDLVSEPRGRYYVISIGINEYRDAFWPALRWAAADATSMLGILGKDTRYERVAISLVNQAATLSNVRTVLDDVARKVAPRDIVVLYLSGHGTLAPDSDGDLMRVAVMHDTQKSELAATGLIHNELRRWLDRLRANKKMMILATCNSGLGKSKLTAEVTQYLRTHKGALVPLADVSEGALILSAAARDEAAREDDQLGGDVYTHYFISATTANDRNRDGMITAMEAHDYAKEQTWVHTNGKQRPSAEAKFVGDADIPVVGRKRERGLPVLDAYSEQWTGYRISVNGRAKGTIPTAVVLDRQHNDIIIYSPTTNEPLGNYQVWAVSGEAINIDDVLYSRPIHVGLRLQNYRWNDHAWSAVTGSDSTMKLELDVGLASRSWAAGLTLHLPEDRTATVAPNLEAKTTWSSNILFVEYGRKFGRWNVATRANALFEQVELELHDTVVNRGQHYADRQWGYGLGLAGGYEFSPDLQLVASYAYQNIRWQLGDAGSLDGRRSTIGVGIQYRFDPSIRPGRRG